LGKTVPQQRPAHADAGARGPWILAAAGVIVFHLAWRFQGEETHYWLPGLGLGIALLSWLGWRILPLLALDLLLARWLTHAHSAATIILADTLLHTLQIALSWWLYHQVAHGSRWLDDPRSATIFLILVPGGLSAFAAIIQAFYGSAPDVDWMSAAAAFWLSRMVGILVVVPFLIVTCTPILLRYRLVDLELPPAFFGERDSGVSRVGDRIELVGLTFATNVLAVLLLWTHLQGSDAKWMLWASCLVLIVWTCIRQGVGGGCFSAGITSVVVLSAAQILAQILQIPADMQRSLRSGIQGNLLAFCSSALLVGVSASWIRANETRYRHVVGRIPFVVYSARLPYGIPACAAPEPGQPRRDSKRDLSVGPSISKLANVLLVNPACKLVFGCDPESLIGPFERMLEQIVAEDRELVIAALTQLCLQKLPVTCEYRLHGTAGESAGEVNHQAGPARFTPITKYRWVRDTLTPHYAEEGLVDGWEGLIEDITQQRALSHNLRQLTSMLQVLIANLPTGVYFVQAPLGHPILVNARARQLLGQREDLSAGLAALSKVFRLHRSDGTEYPWEELPVSKALREGVACRANDIFVHRADGRKIPLITWAAPIDLHNTGVPDAAVWVLEDWSAMQQAELAHITTQRRLEEELVHAKHLELVGRLASGIVHDFNNLLMVLMGLAGCAKTELTDVHPAWQYLTRIEDVGEQASHLAGQLLTFSKQRPRQSRAVDLNAVVTQTLKLASSVMPVNIAVETILDETLPKVLGDENQLKQVAMNLSLNARDAMSAGGKLTIRTDRAAPPNPNGKSWVHLSIQDTGHGMEEDVRSRVFEPFFSTKERGTGLGLVVVQQIIKESDGIIEVWSKPGAGTRFDIWLRKDEG
jgi:signal transduction histidine kinase